MTTNNLPTIVLIPAAWHGVWSFAALVSELNQRGFDTVTAELPGHGTDTRPLGDLADDAKAVRDIVGAITGNVILVGHSYAGLVIGETVADKEIASKVKHLVYLCALCLPAGVAYPDLPADHSRSLLNPLLRFDKEASEGIARLAVEERNDLKACFYNDCTDAQADEAISQLGLHRVATFGSIVTGDPVRQIASTYVSCTEDRVIPIEVQRAMIEAVRATGVAIEEVSLPASHSPFLSMPDRLADSLATVARHVVAQTR
jgi:pimeloyl-ACP methyl ester carboxylesterase